MFSCLCSGQDRGRENTYGTAATTSVSDPHRFYADPDPDPAFLLNADPDPDPTCRI
jgi:hypothetical protein